MLRQLRYGRAVDNRRLKAAGYAFRATSRETVLAFAHHLRTRNVAEQDGGYRYERDVEEFLRWSPSVGGGDRLGLGRLSAEQLAELARALESLRDERPGSEPAPDPLRAGAPKDEPPAG